VQVVNAIDIASRHDLDWDEKVMSRWNGKFRDSAWKHNFGHYDDDNDTMTTSALYVR